jgi:dienelactone hydrolase
MENTEDMTRLDCIDYNPLLKRLNKTASPQNSLPSSYGLTKIRTIMGILFLVFLAGCAPALKDLPQRLSATDSGNIWFASAGSLVSAPDKLALTDGDPVVISGELLFPQGAGPFPAVILAHGCAGIQGAEKGWAAVLREWGYATFVIDSFTGRGLREVCTSPSALMSIQRIPDVYGALRILVTNLKIDARRVALMGFSHGGGLTLGASTWWAREKYAPEGRPAFRAFFPLYPPCNIIFPERERVSAPVRIHTGELDDAVYADPCKKLTESLITSGQDMTITVYPNAHHSFDDIGRAQIFYPFGVKLKKGCTMRLNSILGPVLTPLDELKNCSGYGFTIGYNFEATEQARRNVRMQLGELMK